jgi:hypothetical protein
MDIERTTYVGVGPAVSPIRRISWAAVFAGVAVALVAHLVLSLLGIGIGAATVNPETEANPWAGVGVGAGIWMVVSMLLALFTGGWTASKMAGAVGRTESTMHGVVTWSLAMLFSVYLFTTTIGGLLGGVTSILARSASMTAMSASGEMRGEASRAITGDTSAREAAIDALAAQRGIERGEAERIMERLTPDNTAQAMGQAADNLSRAALWTVLAMVLAGVAAAAGGYLGRAREVVAV